MTTPIVILGAGGTSLDILDFIQDLNDERPTYEVLGLLDDNPALQGASFHGVPLLGSLDQVSRFDGALFANGLGSPRSFRLREALLERLGLGRERFATIIHPTARISRTAAIGLGGVIYPHVSVLANVRVGDHVTVLANSVLNHDVEVGDFTIVTSGVNVSGRVRIGRACYIGTGTAIIQDCAIGEGSMVGMGSVVLGDVPANRVVVGNPARVLRPVQSEV